MEFSPAIHSGCPQREDRKISQGACGGIMPPRTKGKQVNIYFPEGLIDEMATVMEEANVWMNIQEFVRDAVKEKVDRYYKEHVVK